MGLFRARTGGNELQRMVDVDDVEGFSEGRGLRVKKDAFGTIEVEIEGQERIIDIVELEGFDVREHRERKVTFTCLGKILGRENQGFIGKILVTKTAGKSTLRLGHVLNISET